MDDILNYEKREEDDLYFILGCTEQASEDQIAAEYKARVLLCHPDKNPNDQSSHDQFARLSQAKAVLLDPEKRKDYDKWRRSGLAMSFDLWKSRPHMKTYMHWGVKKEQISIPQDSTPLSSASVISIPQDSTPLSSASDNAEGNGQKSSPGRYVPEMNFVHREDQSRSGWNQDTSNPLLQKFRNYEI